MIANADQDASLRLAVIEGRMEGVLAALAQGADPNRPDSDGWTPLTWAAGAGAVDTVIHLLSAGADPLVQGNDRRTPYTVAVSAGQSVVAELLASAEMAAGGDPERRSSRRHETRPYCRAYFARQLRAFPGWREETPSCADPRPQHIDPSSLEQIADDDVLFLHRDLRVTRSVFDDELQVFDGVAPGWAEFCDRSLAFRPLDDLAWMNATRNSTDARS